MQERERKGGFASIHHSFCISLCQILKVEKNPKMKVEVNLKLYKDKLLIRGKIIETLLVVVVVEIYYKA